MNSSQSRTSTTPTKLALCTLLAGCALASKSDPWTTRYFSPEAATGSEAAPAASDSGNLQLRLGRINAGKHLRERIAFRSSEHELGYYEDRRWTEQPDVYLRRALAAALFERRGIRRVVSGGSPTLEVELVAFEEIRGQQPRARLRAVVLLHDQRSGHLERTIGVERALPEVDADHQPEAVAEALAETLRVAVEQISTLVMTQLSEAAATTSCPCNDPGPSAAK
jgi:cholesterol transport system auxiliary component